MMSLSYTQHRGFALLLLLCLTLWSWGCGGDGDDDAQNDASDGFARVTGPQGSSFTVTYANGSTEEITSTAVIPWEGGQLLDGNYFRVLRFNAGDEQFWLRYSFGADVKWDEVVYREYALSEAVDLEDSGDINGVVAEFYTYDDDPFEGNAQGEVELRRNVSVNGTVYAVVGLIDATWMTAEGTISMKGTLWVQEL